jgi:hypothetical protein
VKQIVGHTISADRPSVALSMKASMPATAASAVISHMDGYSVAASTTSLAVSAMTSTPALPMTTA